MTSLSFDVIKKLMLIALISVGAGALYAFDLNAASQEGIYFADWIRPSSYFLLTVAFALLIAAGSHLANTTYNQLFQRAVPKMVRQFCAISGMVAFIGVCGVVSVVFPYQLTAHGMYLAKLEMDAIHGLYTKFDEVHLTLNRVKYENDQLEREVARLKNAEQLRLERDAEIRSEPNDPDDWSIYF